VEFLHVKVLFLQILENSWNHRLVPHQNAAVSAMKGIIGAELTERVVGRLLTYLQETAIQKMDGQSYQLAINDSLELVKSLTQPQPKSPL
jgi:hypothetical protein